jgi:hypothetical protein
VQRRGSWLRDGTVVAFVGECLNSSAQVWEIVDLLDVAEHFIVGSVNSDVGIMFIEDDLLKKTFR